jgi:NAD(P)H-hydrate epimerase
VIPLAQVAEVVAADEAAQAAGTPVATLMGRAGGALATVGRELLAGAAGRRVLALAGKGHNGGDAMEAAARLAAAGAGAEVLLTADEDALDAEGRRCAALVRARGGRVLAFDPAGSGRFIDRADLLIDGLLGTGSSGAPRGLVAAAIQAAGRAGAPVLAVDIASGVDGSTGAVPGPAISAAATVTFQAAKPGHVLAPGSGRAGTLVVADIGLPLASAWGISEPGELAALVPLPGGELHKRSRGVLLLVAGASGMGGAPTLAAMAARRAGTGLLVAATPASVAERVGAAVPEALTVALDEAGGGITPKAIDQLERWLGEATAVAVGPGLGRTDGTRAAVTALLGATERPLVADADALFALGAADVDGERLGPLPALAKRAGPTLLTPHAGEFARLAPGLGGTRLAQAAAASAAWGASVLLKGADTVIAEPGGRLAVNRTGTAALATGGSGDVLTGLCGALLCQGLPPFDAARLAAFLHGRAGALATTHLSAISVAASDVATHLPAALRELLTGAVGAAATGAHQLPGARR